MKAQGLPMSFIVIAVMAVLVLLAVTLLFLKGFRTESFDRQTAINNCDSACSLEVQYAVKGGTYPHSNSPFCKLTQSVKGIGDNLKCTDLTTCRINSSCDISCSSTTANC